jgi:hypothetical protein
MAFLLAALVTVFRQAVAPVLATYLAYVAMLLAHARRGHRGRARRTESTVSSASLVSTMLGGYLFFLVIIIVFYFIVANQPARIIGQAVWQGLLLLFAIVIPGFMLLSGAAAVGRGRPPGQRIDAHRSDGPMTLRSERARRVRGSYRVPGTELPTR